MLTQPSDRVAAITDRLLQCENPLPSVVETGQISQAFTARGDAFLANGEYHLAVRDSGDALNHRCDDGQMGSECNPAARENRYEALICLYWFFRAKGNPDHPDPAIPDWARDAVRKAKIPHGYLVVGDDNILISCPLDSEGREEAIAVADELANDSTLRFMIDNRYLTETDEFDTVVYSYDGTTLEEVHRAPARDEDGAPTRD